MFEFMSTIRFPSEIDQEFIDLIPAQRSLINELMRKGVITSYSLSADRRTLWVITIAESEQVAEEVLRKMPLYKYMEYTIQALMFHNTPLFAQPVVSMN